MPLVSPLLRPVRTRRVGYARCSTDKQDLAAQRAALIALDVAEDRIYTDHGLTGTNPERPDPGAGHGSGP